MNFSKLIWNKDTTCFEFTYLKFGQDLLILGNDRHQAACCLILLNLVATLQGINSIHLNLN